jgi:HlyD family secretion protein
MNATTVQNVVTYDTIVDFDNPDLKLFPGMTAYVSIPVASANDVVKIPNAALRFKPDLPADQIQALYQRYGISSPQGPSAQRTEQPGGGVKDRPTPASNGKASAETAVVWKLLPDKSLQPLQVHVGLTDHTFTALADGDLKPGDELVTGVTTAKSGSSGPSLGAPRR